MIKHDEIRLLITREIPVGSRGLYTARLSTHQRQAPHRDKRIRRQAIEVNPRGHRPPALIAPVPDQSVAASR